ncbi:hypothetical protein ACQ9PV_26210, partial [Escherichia coli]
FFLRRDMLQTFFDTFRQLCCNLRRRIAPQKEIGFSSGIYAMKENDTLHDAYKASDERLYVNKQNKNSRS